MVAVAATPMLTYRPQNFELHITRVRLSGCVAELLRGLLFGIFHTELPRVQSVLPWSVASFGVALAPFIFCDPPVAHRIWRWTDRSHGSEIVEAERGRTNAPGKRGYQHDD